MVNEKCCLFCEDLEDNFKFYMHYDYDGGYSVEYHDGYFCPKCGRNLKVGGEKNV